MKINNPFWYAIILQIIMLFFIAGATIDYETQTQQFREKCFSTITDYNNTIYENVEIINHQFEIITNMSKEIDNLTNQIKILEYEKKRLISELSMEYRTQNQLKESIKQAKKERGLINPTFKQLKRFIRTDKTDENEWKDDYDCSEFSYEFVRNFAEEGYNSGTTELTLIEDNEEFGHIIVAVNTTDKGFIFVEPQTDDIIKDINVNDDYCDLVNWDCRWIITKISSKFELKI